MDLLSIIRGLSNDLPEDFQTSGIEAIALHIERAEKYWHRAKAENDELLFTDVIYRTNQAFEGALKEAYSILAGRDPSKTTPYKIEKYLDGSDVLKERVLAALSNYRVEWRNSSTHNYQLFFTEQEALLAISSVSTFCVILLEQIGTKANELHERARVANLSSTVLADIGNYDGLTFPEKVGSLLAQTYKYIELPDKRRIREYEYLGMLVGFIEAVDPQISISTEVRISDRHKADLILESNGRKVLVELKRHDFFSRFQGRFFAQLVEYLHESELIDGILMTFDEHATRGTWERQDIQQTLFDEDRKLIYVHPSSTAT